MDYNNLWCIAWTFASATDMTIHRTQQFASDYAQVFEGINEADRVGPAGFAAWAECHDFHYHDHKQES